MWDGIEFTEHLCEDVQCGKGTCKVDITSPAGFICECDANWQRMKDYDDDDNDVEDLRFLPCVIPNCKLILIFDLFIASLALSFSSKFNFLQK